MAERIEIEAHFKPTGLETFAAKVKAAMSKGIGMDSSFLESAGLIPPVIKPPIIGNQHKKGGGINFGQLFGGLATAPFSPWIASRMIGGSGLFGRGGAGKGAGEDLFGIGGLSGFSASFVAIEASTKALKLAFDTLAHAVQQGATLYEQSARTATDMATLSRLQRSFQAVGLPADAATKMLENVFLSRGKGIAASIGSMSGGQLTNLIKGVGSGELADLQQIMNMAPEFQKAWNDMAGDAEKVAEKAGVMQILKQSTVEMKSAFEGLAATVVGDFAPALTKVVDHVTDKMKEISNMDSGKLVSGLLLILGGPTAWATLSKPVQDAAAAAAAAAGGAGGPKKPGENRLFEAFRPQPRSEWERMGLIINGGIAGNDYAKQTANNTKRIADVLVGKTGGPMPFLQGLPSQNMP